MAIRSAIASGGTLLALTGLGGLAACGSTSNTGSTEPVANTASSTSGSGESTSPTVSQAPADAGSVADASTSAPTGLAALEAIGPLHATPVELAASDEHLQLAFVGGPDRADSAWWVSDHEMPGGPLHVAGWPVRVRVLGGVSRAQDSRAYVLVETLEAPGQPAGQKAVLPVTIGAPTEAHTMAQVTDADEGAEVYGAQSMDELSARLARRPVDAPPAEDTVAHCRQLARAGASPALLANAVSADGLDAVTETQPNMLVGRHYTAAEIRALPAGPERAALLGAVTALRNAEPALGGGPECGNAQGATRYTLEGGQAKLRRVLLPSPAAPHVTPAAAAVRLVPTTEITEATQAAWRTVFGPRGTLLAQAELTPGGGTIAVGDSLQSDDYHTLQVMVIESGITRLFDSVPLDGTEEAYGPENIRFADLNGDGRTDVVVWASRGGTDDGAPAVKSAAGVITPQPTLADRNVVSDYSIAMAAWGTPDADAAMRAIVAISPHGVSVRDACRLLGAIRTPAALRAAGTADLLVGNIGNFEGPLWNTSWRAPANIPADELRGLPQSHIPRGADCRRLHCPPNRPFCETPDPSEELEQGPPPTRRMIWFDVTGTTPHLRAISYYEAT